jgi:hypothetical protein
MAETIDFYSNLPRSGAARSVLRHFRSTDYYMNCYTNARYMNHYNQGGPA